MNGDYTWDFISRFINVFAILSAISGSTWFISNQFSGIRNSIRAEVDIAKESFLDKLEYHEQHDDKRFENVLNSLWEIKLRLTSLESLLLIPREKKAT